MERMSWSRRDLVKAGGLMAVGSAVGSGLLSQSADAQTSLASAAEEWDVFEVSYPGPANGNPFVDVEFGARFEQGGTSIATDGFYDGGGVYRVRFMPASTGVWTYRTQSNHPELDGKTGSFAVRAAQPGNMGPVRVKDQFHFVYANGSPYRELGTTCYAWTSQPAALEEQTLKTLADAPFNKMRMCVFPKWYHYNQVEPPQYPFAGEAPNHWDFTRFNPAYFRNFETRVGQLGKLGIEADVILFHPYDEGHWGFDNMGATNTTIAICASHCAARRVS